MEKFVEELKQKYPKTWSKFKDYLRDNYEFWSKEETNENTLWFCERDPRSQIGYFYDWLCIINYKNDLNNIESNPSIQPSEGVIVYCIRQIKLVFKYLEEHEK